MLTNSPARQQDPGLQPQRTSLAWYRTLLSSAALLALALRHHALLLQGMLLLMLAMVLMVCIANYLHAQKRKRMDTLPVRVVDRNTVINNLLISINIIVLAGLVIGIQLSH